MGICWYCYWGWPKVIRDIYERAIEKLGGDNSALNYGPAHIVWEDENFDSARSCLDTFDRYSKGLSDEQKGIVRWSLEQLLLLPERIINSEPEEYDGEHPYKFPPPVDVEWEGRINRLFIMVGYPGSGKSTWARGKIAECPDIYCVSRDSFRRMVGAGVYRFEKGKLEDMIKSVTCITMRTLLSSGNVIVDETNLTIKKRAEWIEIAREAKAIPVIVWCKESGLEECLNRRMKDDPRGYDRVKWEEVIIGMRATFEPPTSVECEVVEVV